MAHRAPTLHPVERLMLAYVTLAGAIALVRTPQYPRAAWAVVAHLLIAALLLVVARASTSSRWVAGLRDALPLLLLIGLYPLLDVVNMGGAVATHDAAIQRWDQALFGMQPSRDWWRRHPSVFWSTVLHGAYFSYYALVAVPALTLVFRPDRRGLRLFASRVVTTFMISYVVFVLFPVSGPYYQFAWPTGTFVANLPARLVYGSLTGGSSFGAAFPSSHVAATVTATLVALRVLRPVGLVMVAPALLLCVSVVYCQMHYASDAIAGLALGLVVGGWPVRGLGGEKGER